MAALGVGNKHDSALFTRQRLVVKRSHGKPTFETDEACKELRHVGWIWSADVDMVGSLAIAQPVSITRLPLLPSTHQPGVAWIS